MRQRKAHGIVVHFVDSGNQLTKLQTLEIGVVAVRDVMVRMLRVFLPHERENDVVGIKITRWSKILIALKFHSFAQVESVHLAIFADLPALGQTRLKFGRTGFKIDEPVINRNRAGVDAGSRGIELRVEILRRSF